MNPFALLAGVFAVHLLAMMSPGPNVLVVTQTAASRTRRAGVLAALGIASAAGVWASAALLGLGALYARFGWLRSALELLGGAYLLWLGVRLWRGAAQPPARAPLPSLRDDRQAYAVGFVTNMTNPKALLFYASLFAALLAWQPPLWLKLAALALIVVDSAGWHVALAWLFSTARAQRLYERSKARIERAAGTALAALGLWLLAPGGRE